MNARLPLLAGNWKMNHDHLAAIATVQKLAWALRDAKVTAEHAEVALLVPFTDIRSVQTLVQADKLPLAYGAQDVSAHSSGAYTGEVSAQFLQALSCSYVIVGHSERREYHREDDALVAQKLRATLDAGMTPILCVGESLEQRQAGTHVDFTLGQLAAALADFSAAELASLVIAYEPVWAIGTGEVATAADAGEMANSIRTWFAENKDRVVAEQVRILYGGSVKADNVAEIIAHPDVDGALVGGASLEADDFSRLIVNAVRG